MYLRTLELVEFRSFRKLELEIDPRGFRAVGANASGKSTLLETMAMLATTRSPRTSAERELPNWLSGQDLAVPPYARLCGEFHRHDGEHRVEIGVSVDDLGGKALKKSIRVDNRAVRAVDAVGQLKTVLFAPNDVDLLSGAPGGRRRYLDIAISQGNRAYLAALSRYGRVLEQRNSLLRSFARDGVSPTMTQPRDQLAFWDREIAATATDVLAYRLTALAAWSDRARAHFATLTGSDSLEITYQASRVVLPGPSELGARWDSPSQSLRQGVSAAFAGSLAGAIAEELKRGVTAIGPHRDDFSVFAGGSDLGRFGSRGQQRLAVVAIKLAELDLLEEAAGEPPVLLLDDVLSELDESHRRSLVSAIGSRHAQVCVTATDASDLRAPELESLPLLLMRPGAVEVSREP